MGEVCGGGHRLAVSAAKASFSPLPCSSACQVYQPTHTRRLHVSVFISASVWWFRCYLSLHTLRPAQVCPLLGPALSRAA